MDDFLSGADTLENALQLRNEVMTVLNSAGFELRKWSSNAPEFLLDVPTLEAEKTTDCSEIGHKFAKILGLFRMTRISITSNPTIQMCAFAFGRKFMLNFF